MTNRPPNPDAPLGWGFTELPAPVAQDGPPASAEAVGRSSGQPNPATPPGGSQGSRLPQLLEPLPALPKNLDLGEAAENAVDLKARLRQWIAGGLLWVLSEIPRVHATLFTMSLANQAGANPEAAVKAADFAALLPTVNAMERWVSSLDSIYLHGVMGRCQALMAAVAKAEWSKLLRLLIALNAIEANVRLVMSEQYPDLCTLVPVEPNEKKVR